jgi:CRP/FNR family cyclic AMP-dependent transcriptional regulator
VNSSTGKEAVVAILEPRDFFGEGCVAGQKFRVVRRLYRHVIEKQEMMRAIHEEHEFSDRFVAHMN